MRRCGAPERRLMARDYAKGRGGTGRSAATRRSSGKSARRGLPGWMWGLLLGLTLGLAAAAWVWIARPARPAPLAAIVNPPAPASEPPKAIPLPPKQPSRFAFYEMLPSYEVVIPREDAAASARSGKATTPEIAAPGQYLIQVGSFKTRDEAERNRASLALLGVESKVEQVTIDQSESWFRVRIGPETSLPKAQEIMQRLDENGIKGMLIKVKA
jgi:cell division protein FtsN